MSKDNYQKPEFTREHRLGLVVYGGVSLAIYMNGVCREFYNAVRGRGIYKLIKALTDSDIIVDIISGTSAGGINGVLLSYALTNSNEQEIVDFENFDQVWRDSGNIRKLIRQPKNHESNQAESLFDGENYYQKALETAFNQAQSNKKPAPSGEWLSPSNELDLFVTGTDVLGQVYKVFDQTGSVIEVNNHRAVFQLKHRQGRKEPFNFEYNPAVPKLNKEELHQSLAKLCRITSCFPVAFPVVTVELKNTDNHVDSMLARWGDLENRDLPKQPPDGGYRLHFVDGGVLDNRPFSYTIKEMYYRTANRPVDRKLFYIDPSPDRFSNAANFQNMVKPKIGQVIQDSLIGLPTYESIANDLQAIKERNEKVRRYRGLLANVEAPINSGSPTTEKIDVQEGIYLLSRLISLRDRLLPLILRMQQNDVVNYDKKKILEKIAELLTERILDPEERKIRDKTLQEFGEQIRNLDIEYALRKHFYILQKICQKLETEQDDDQYKQLKFISQNISRQIKLLEVIRAALDLLMSNKTVSEFFYQLIDQANSDNQLRSQIYDSFLRLHRYLLDAYNLPAFSPTNAHKTKLVEVSGDFFLNLPGLAQKLNEQEWLPQQQISSILEQLKQKILQLQVVGDIAEDIQSNDKFNYDGQENKEFTTILLKVELSTEALIHNSNLSTSDELLKRFRGFRQVDQVVYPFEYLTEIGEKEIINTVRISPDDAQLGLGKSKGLEDKLAGDTLYAFAGFFKKSWRSNDILWGRLDGLNKIVEALITPETIKRFPHFIQREAYKKRCSKEDYLEFLLDESLNKNAIERETIKSYLQKLIQPNFQFNQIELNEFLDAVVMAGHRVIINTDLQNVISDAIEEQFTWNLQRVKPENIKPKNQHQGVSELPIQGNYNPVKGYFDKTVSALAATKIAEEAVDSWEDPHKKEHFFRHEYSVGKEKLDRDVPNIILVNLATRSVLVARNIINNSLGINRVRRLSRHPIYQFFDKSLQLFYWWLQYRGPVALESASFNRGRPIILILQVALLVVAIAGVAITVSQSWVWIAIALGATVLFWLIGLLRKSQ
ncbi:MAG TPA: patatin-like protein [Oculatellaceae cyanobacterium]|jgi:patatin-related protein